MLSLIIWHKGDSPASPKLFNNFMSIGIILSEAEARPIKSPGFQGGWGLLSFASPSSCP